MGVKLTESTGTFQSLCKFMTELACVWLCIKFSFKLMFACFVVLYPHGKESDLLSEQIKHKLNIKCYWQSVNFYFACPNTLEPCGRASEINVTKLGIANLTLACWVYSMNRLFDLMLSNGSMNFMCTSAILFGILSVDLFSTCRLVTSRKDRYNFEFKDGFGSSLFEDPMWDFKCAIVK